MNATKNIWKEEKIHISKHGAGTKPLCGASSSAQPITRVAYSRLPDGVTCLRCIKSFDAAMQRQKSHGKPLIEVFKDE